MKIFSKFLLTLLLLSVAVFAAGCGSDEEATKDEAPMSSAEEINRDYEEAMEGFSDGEYEKISSDNPIVNEFTSTDFQFTIADSSADSSGAESAFNVPKNGYAVMTPASASFGYIGMAENIMEGSFKNAKGYGFENTVSQIVESYKVSPEGLYSADASKTAFAFVSTDGVAFSALTGSDLQTAIQCKDSATNPTSSLSAYHTIAIIELSADENGTLNKYSIYHYCKDSEDGKHNH